MFNYSTNIRKKIDIKKSRGNYFVKIAKKFAVATVVHNGVLPSLALQGPRWTSGPQWPTSLPLVARGVGAKVLIHAEPLAREGKSSPINLLKQKPNFHYYIMSSVYTSCTQWAPTVAGPKTTSSEFGSILVG